jgi:hypothetical protein
MSDKQLEARIADMSEHCELMAAHIVTLNRFLRIYERRVRELSSMIQLQVFEDDKQIYVRRQTYENGKSDNGQ